MSISVLIADHRKDQLLVLGEFLLQLGVEATACTGGSRALAAVLARAEAGAPYDLVIAHVDLPGVPGLRLLYEARSRHLSTVAAVTCPDQRRGDPRVESMIRKVGAAVLVPPLEPSRVEDLLATALERRRSAPIGPGEPPVARPLGARPAAKRARSLDIEPVLELSPEEFEVAAREIEAVHRRMSSGELSVAGYLAHGSGMYGDDDLQPSGTRRHAHATTGTAGSEEATARRIRDGKPQVDHAGDRQVGPDDLES